MEGSQQSELISFMVKINLNYMKRSWLHLWRRPHLTAHTDRSRERCGGRQGLPGWVALSWKIRSSLRTAVECRDGSCALRSSGNWNFSPGWANSCVVVSGRHVRRESYRFKLWKRKLSLVSKQRKTQKILKFVDILDSTKMFRKLNFADK